MRFPWVTPVDRAGERAAISFCVGNEVPVCFWKCRGTISETIGSRRIRGLPRAPTPHWVDYVVIDGRFVTINPNYVNMADIKIRDTVASDRPEDLAPGSNRPVW